MIIKSLKGKIIKATDGRDTIGVDLVTDNGVFSASVPAGISTGKHEVPYVPVQKAISEIESIIKPKIKGMSVKDQNGVDKVLASLDIGGNSSLAVSIAVCRSGNNLYKEGITKTPVLLMLFFEGGKHGSGILEFQEFMVAIRNYNRGKKLFSETKLYLDKNKIAYKFGAEGAMSPLSLNNIEVLDIMHTKILEPKDKIALDVAGTHLSAPLSIQNYKHYLNDYPIFWVEDPHAEDEWGLWKEFYQEFSSKLLIIADDLVVTNYDRVKRAIDEKTCNGIVIKPNQIGTVSETLRVIEFAKKNELAIVVSHRGAETLDNFIADLAYFTEADFVKFGGLEQKERLIKYERLIELQKS